MEEKKKFDTLLLIIERWQTLILIYFFDLMYVRHSKNPYLLQFYWLYEFCILQLPTTEVIVSYSGLVARAPTKASGSH